MHLGYALMMRLPGNTTVVAFAGIALGAFLGGAITYALGGRAPFHGIPAPLFDETYFYNHGTVGPAGIFSGMWVDGFEESRFFPDTLSISTTPIPETTSRIQMDTASTNLVHRFMVKPLTPGCSDILAVRFMGNAIRPSHGFGMPGYIETIYVPTEILSVKSLKRVC